MINTKSSIVHRKYSVLAIAIALVAVVGAACASDTNSTPDDATVVTTTTMNVTHQQKVYSVASVNHSLALSKSDLT